MIKDVSTAAVLIEILIIPSRSREGVREEQTHSWLPQIRKVDGNSASIQKSTPLITIHCKLLPVAFFMSDFSRPSRISQDSVVVATATLNYKIAEQVAMRMMAKLS